MKTGPIIIIEDDKEDREIFKDIMEELEVRNELIWFHNSQEALTFFKTTDLKPFIIFCDVNLGGTSGIAIKSQIDADPQLRKKSIPFIFYSTSADQQSVNKAYTEMTVQGYFLKNNSYQEIRDTVKIILDYWKVCRHPNF
ncbi:MAG TPA: response regulator [Chitinophagaceae bacterium]|nr:response regulator [Chitinophagaceae bacterium]